MVRRGLPQAVLFACGLNAVRSPMAAALMKGLAGNAVYVGSAGARKGERDPFAVGVWGQAGNGASLCQRGTCG